MRRGRRTLHVMRYWHSTKKWERVGRISLPPRGRCRGLPRRKEPTKVLGFAFSLSQLSLTAPSQREPFGGSKPPPYKRDDEEISVLYIKIKSDFEKILKIFEKIF